MEGSTPLLMACCKGKIASVKRIVEFWKVDVNTAAVFYSSNGMVVEGVTPLVVAAKYCHSSIVHYLLWKGANVAIRTTDEGYTPLHAAIIGSAFVPVGKKMKQRQISIIRCLLRAGADPSVLPFNEKPIWLDKSCGPEILTLLIQSGMDLSQRCPITGSTVLHLWASHYFDKYHRDSSEKSLKVVQLLVKKGADIHAIDNNGFTPILSAAMDSWDLSWIEGPQPDENSLPNLLVLDFLLEQNDITRMEKISALEMAGAVIIGNDIENKDLFHLGFEYWRRALALRLMDSAGCMPIHKKTPSLPKHDRIIEWTTRDELQQIEQCPSQREIQSLLVKFRILSDMHWEVVNCHFWNHMRYFTDGCGNGYFPPHRRILSLSLIWTVLEKVNYFSLDYLTDIVDPITRIFEELNEYDPLLNSEMLKTSLDLIIAAWKSSQSTDEGNYNDSELDSLSNFIESLTSSPIKELLSDEMMRSLHSLLRLDICDQDGLNLLHYAFYGEFRHNVLGYVDLLLRLEMDPNTVSNNGDTPLHLLGLLYGGKDLDVDEGDETARLLLKHGANIDVANNEGMTVVDILIRKREEEKKNNPKTVFCECWDLPGWCRKSVPNLSCLSARVVRRKQVPHLKVGLPVHLPSFIAEH